MKDEHEGKLPPSNRDEKLGLLIWFRMARVYNRSVRETQQHLKQWSLSAAQFDVLAQVSRHACLTQQQLADKLYVTKGNVTQLLSKLEERGLIVREQQWKSKFISLTEEGKQLLQAIMPIQEAFQASRFDGLDKEEKKQLLKLLRKSQINTD